MADAMLALDGVDAGYGSLQVLRGVTLSVAPGEIVSLIGPNGAGKTTVIRAILGLIPLRPRSGGAIRFRGLRIDGLAPEDIVRRGIAVRPSNGAPTRNIADRFPMDRWNAMKAEDRDRVLSKLPPDRQQKIRDQIARFNSLPESEQQRLRERYQRLQQMAPEKQDAIRRELRQFNETAPERRRALAREMRQLRGLSEGDRRARIAGDEYRNRYTPDERQMLQDLTDYLSPARND
jgi:ABC-type Fe3+/spermidine/putrescine transport system ATPase subunit